MKHDMKKIIIERPRVGGNYVKKEPKPKFVPDKLDLEDYDSGPSKVSLTKHLGYEGKQQTDLLGPLKRFLYKNVGKKWDDVWSEICEHNKDLMGSHLKDHVHWMVETDVYYNEQGELVNIRGHALSIYGGIRQFYVDPKNGILCCQQNYRRKWTDTTIQRIFNIDGQDYYRYDGIWYRVTTKVPQKGERNANDVFGYRIFKDLWDRSYIDTFGLQKAYGKTVYCVSKQQANSKECKKLNKMVNEALKKAS